eukprot:IDg14524t1
MRSSLTRREYPVPTLVHSTCLRHYVVRWTLEAPGIGGATSFLYDTDLLQLVAAHRCAEKSSISSSLSRMDPKFLKYGQKPWVPSR